MNNYSKQREIILNVIKELFHPTSEEIYNKVHEVNSSISKSTVYRNIQVLLDNKIIKKIKVLNGPDKYEYNCGEHYHVLCKICGNVYDFMYNFNQENLKKEIYLQTKMNVKIDSLTLYGICENCKTKESIEEE